MTSSLNNAGVVHPDNGKKKTVLIILPPLAALIGSAIPQLTYAALKNAVLALTREFSIKLERRYAGQLIMSSTAETLYYRTGPATWPGPYFIPDSRVCA